jgi:tungstate transport system ATP-binding protein
MAMKEMSVRSEPSFLLEARNLMVKRAGVTTLSVPELLIRKGEILSLIGPNGAGKTTLMQTLCYLFKPRQGAVFFKGLKVGQDLSPSLYRRNVTMVFQEPLLFHTTVFKNVAAGLNFRHLGRGDTERLVEENLVRFGIAHLRDRSARTLSGGEAQRTSLARAFATRPEILFLDEPFAALDPPTREGLTEDLEKILRESQTTAVLATHDRSEAFRLSDRIAFLSGGVIRQIGSASDLVNNPVDELVAAFVGVETVLSGLVVAGVTSGTAVVSVAGHAIEVATPLNRDELAVLCISPENVVISNHLPAGKTSARNVFAGTAAKIVPLGPFYKVYLDCGFPLAAFITPDSLRDLALAEGAQVTVSFKATAVHVISTKGPLQS